MKNKFAIYLVIALLLIISNAAFCANSIDSLKSIISANPNLNDTSKVKIFNQISRYLYKSDYEESVSYSKRALQLSEKINFTSGIFESYYTLIYALQSKGDYIQGLRYAYKAMVLAETKKDLLAIANIYSFIGLIHHTRNENQKSLENLEKSVKYYQKIGKSDVPTSVLGNLANAYTRSKKYDEAISIFEKLLKIAIEKKDSTNISRAYTNIGIVYYSQKKTRKALEYMEISEKHSRHLGNKYMDITNLNNIAELSYIVAQDSATSSKEKQLLLNNSIKACQKAIKLALEMDATPQLIEIYNNYSNSSKAINDWKNAYIYREKHIALKDSIYSEENNQKIVDIENDFKNKLLSADLENLKFKNKIQTVLAILAAFVILMLSLYFYKINKTNKLLNEKNQQITQSSQELEILNENLIQRENELIAANAAKDKFFSIIAHDLKNPFVTLLINSDLLVSKFDIFDDAKKLKLISQIRNVSKNTFQLLENLLIWAQTQTGRSTFNPIPVNVAELIEKSNSLYLSQAEVKNIDIKFEIPNDTIVLADKEMLNTIFRNIISNAIKYSHDGAFINVGVQKYDDVSLAPKIDKEYICFYVKDEGTGLSGELQDKLFTIGETQSLHGTAGEKGTGLGLMLCKEFVERHNGKIWVESEEGIGASFFFTLPKA